MKSVICFLLLFLAVGCSTQSASNVNENTQNLNLERPSVIAKQKWIHGSADCDTNTDPAHEVYKHDEQTLIIRQNKCLTYEAPFIYVLVGELQILVLDTGALSGNPDQSLRLVIEDALGKELFSSKEVLVVHSHGHRDHYRGDSYFEGQSNVRLIKPTASALHQFFNLSQWPIGQATLNLGNRQLTIIPTPGHQEEAITIYDHNTKWLLTGDTLYPGYIYVKDWDAYRNSIDKLDSFASNNEVSAIMGSHIEMKNQSAAYYAIGSTYQPNEAQLDLPVQSLYRLNSALKQQDKATEMVFDEFIIHPMSRFQKMMSNAMRSYAQ